MASIVEVEAWRVSEILGTASNQLELLAMVPRGKRLASVAAGAADRSTTASSQRSRSEVAASTTSDRAGEVDSELEETLLEALRELSLVESAAERRRKEAYGDGGPDGAASQASVIVATQRVARVLESATAKVEARRASGRTALRVPTLDLMRSRLEVRRSRESKPSSASRAAVAQAESKADEDPPATEFPMEGLSGLMSALQLGLRARMRTNAEQEAIRLEFERTVSDRIREARAREGLLLDERRRMEMRHKDEEDRLSEALSKLTLELKDLQAAEERRRQSLQEAVERRETELATAADEAQAAIREELAAARAALAESQGKHTSKEQTLRKQRNNKVRDLGDKIRQYDTDMKGLQQKLDKLERDNAELESHCSALQSHLDLLDENRRVAQEQFEAVRSKAEQRAREFHDRVEPAKRRIIGWFRSLKARWEVERKASKKKGGKK